MKRWIVLGGLLLLVGCGPKPYLVDNSTVCTCVNDASVCGGTVYPNTCISDELPQVGIGAWMAEGWNQQETYLRDKQKHGCFWWGTWKDRPKSCGGTK